MRQDIARAEAVIGILKDWADSMKGRGNRLGYPAQSCGFQSGYVSATFEDMCRNADIERNKIVDACIDDLPNPSHKAAIYSRYLAAVFRMRDYENALAQAHIELMQAFTKKGVLW